MKNKIKIYLDTADIKKIVKAKNNKNISGFTTNPSLLRKNNIKSYQSFIKYLCKKVSKPISFEIFADDEKEIINSKGKSLAGTIKKISDLNIKLNITAVFTFKQFKSAYDSLNKKNFNIISIFAGRIADTGRDPKFIISKCVKYKKNKNIKILWASTREYLNIIQAQNEKCDIITVTPEILSKKKLSGYNLEKFSIDTSKAFYEDAKKMKLKI